jgi:hypothetical protein
MTPRPTQTPTNAPVPTNPATSTVSAAPTFSGIVSVSGWSATCGGLSESDCQGVALVFIHSLGFPGAGLLEATGGRLSIVFSEKCPTVLPDWADSSQCWQVQAQRDTGDEVCEVIARRFGTSVFGFGQVGGDDMSGAAFPPKAWNPCAR